MNIEQLNKKIINSFIQEGILVKIVNDGGVNPFNKDKVVFQLQNESSILAISPFKNLYTEFNLDDTDEQFKSKVDDFKHAVVLKVLEAIEFDNLTVNLNIVPYLFYDAVSKLLGSHKSVRLNDTGIAIEDDLFMGFAMTPCREILLKLIK